MSDKQEFVALLHEVFGMIEDLEVNEGLYLQFAELFKQMNLKVDRLSQIRIILQDNQYYQRHVRRTPTLLQKRLTEAEKAQSANYKLCGCGRYISIHHRTELGHIKTLVHHQGLRNRKYARLRLDEDIITERIHREVTLSGFCIEHYQKQLKLAERA
jgi:hypothetical protein